MAKAGRPKKSIDILPKDWYIEVLELYSEGGSDVEVRAIFLKTLDSFSTDLWYRWLEEEPIFSETIKKGRELSEAWWTSNGRKNLKTKEFNYTGWYMNMKNRFGWADKQETKTENTTNIKGSIDISKWIDEDK